MQETNRPELRELHDEVPFLSIHHIERCWHERARCDVDRWQARNVGRTSCLCECGGAREDLQEPRAGLGHSSRITRHFIP